MSSAVFDDKETSKDHLFIKTRGKPKEMYSEVIHEWICERYGGFSPHTKRSDAFFEKHYISDAYLRQGPRLQHRTIMSKPLNLRVHYCDDIIHLVCWFTYCGTLSAEYKVPYCDPKMFEKIEEKLEIYENFELEAVKTLGKNRNRVTVL